MTEDLKKYIDGLAIGDMKHTLYHIAEKASNGGGGSECELPVIKVDDDGGLKTWSEAGFTEDMWNSLVDCYHNIDDSPVAITCISGTDSYICSFKLTDDGYAKILTPDGSSELGCINYNAGTVFSNDADYYARCPEFDTDKFAFINCSDWFPAVPIHDPILPEDIIYTDKEEPEVGDITYHLNAEPPFESSVLEIKDKNKTLYFWP